MMQPFVNYTYKHSYVHPIEAMVDYRFSIMQWKWMARNWKYSVIISCIYLIAIQVGLAYMRNRKAMDLSRGLIRWNIFLSAFSIIGCVRYTPAFVHSLSVHGFTHTICVTDWHMGVTGFWTTAFVLSKVIELGDTAFLVLRKRPVIFLHYYHHVSVLIFSWYGMAEMAPCGRCFAAMNYIVHSVMYPYYAIRAAGYKVPKWISMLITALQLTQMVLGFTITLGVLRAKLFGILITIPDGSYRQQPCQLTKSSLTFAMICYTSYFYLFAQFFIKAYFEAGKKAVEPSLHGTTTCTHDAIGSDQKMGSQNSTVIQGGGDMKLDGITDDCTMASTDNDETSPVIKRYISYGRYKLQ